MSLSLSHLSCQVALREERDRLLSEKATWAISKATTGPTSEAPADWESEKSQLLKARDDALAQAKVSIHAFLISQHSTYHGYLRPLQMQLLKPQKRLRALNSRMFVNVLKISIFHQLTIHAGKIPN